MVPFTGERYIPTINGEIRVEHLHRYALACQMVCGMDVLDLACGEGYGSAMLSKVAKSVVGLDIDQTVIEHASDTYGHLSNLCFVSGSASKTNLVEGSFDVVVSFETIEHLTEQVEMLKEICRLLKPEGILLISSPNRPVYSQSRDCINEFHAKELDFDEFNNILKSNFENISYYGQRLLIGSVVQSLDIQKSHYKVFTDGGDVIHERSAVLESPMYFIAVCSLSKNFVHDFDNSIFMPDSLDLVEHYVGFARWAKKQDHEIALRDENVRYFKTEAEKFEKQSEILLQQIAAQKVELELIESRRNLAILEFSRVETQLQILKNYLFDKDNLK